jgi:hypothetical protein
LVTQRLSVLVSSLRLKCIFLVDTHQLLTLSAESLLYPKRKVIFCNNHGNLKVYLITVPFSINLCIFISYLLSTVLICVGLIIISILEVKQMRAQTLHSKIPFKNKSRKHYRTCVLRRTVFKIRVTVKWGNTSTQCVTCHDEKRVVTCTHDTQHTAVLGCDRMIVEHTHDGHCACSLPSVSVMATFDGDVYRKETKHHSSCVT